MQNVIVAVNAMCVIKRRGINVESLAGIVTLATGSAQILRKKAARLQINHRMYAMGARSPELVDLTDICITQIMHIGNIMRN